MAYKASLTTGLQSRGFDTVKAYRKEVKVVIRTLEHVRTKMDEFHRDCFVCASDLAEKIDVEVKKTRTCRRQQIRQNVVITEHSSSRDGIEEYFRINVAVPFLNDVLQSMKSRFKDSQTVIAKGFQLVPS